MFFEIKSAEGSFLYRIAYDDLGNPNDDTPIICVHGLGQQRHYFDFLIKELVANGRRVINIDIVGHGESGWALNPSHYEITNYAKDCTQLIFNLGLTNIDWIGNSLGGLIGIRAITEQRLNVQHFIINDVSPYVSVDAADFVANWAAANNVYETEQGFINWRVEATQGQGPMTDDHRRHRAKYDYRINEEGKYIDVYDKAIAINLFKHLENNEVWDDWGLYEKITCPTLLFHGTLSNIMTPEQAERMQTTGPKAQIIYVEGIGHYPAFCDDKQINQILAFLEDKLVDI